MGRDSFLGVVVGTCLIVGVTGTQAQSTSGDELKQLADETTLARARQAKAEAEAAAIAAQTLLEGAKAAQLLQSDKNAKSASEASTERKNAELDESLATVKKLKETFGAPPVVGKEGNVTLTDANNTQLLRVRAGSLKATWNIASNICETMTQDGVTNAFLAPLDLAAKVQRSKMFLMELDAMKSIQAALNPQLAVMQARVTGVIAGLAAARYVVGGVEQLSRVFRDDYSLSLANTSRATMLEYMVAKKCPAALSMVDVEAVYKTNSDMAIKRYYDDLDTLLRFVRLYDSKVGELKKATDDKSKEIAVEEKKGNKADPIVVAKLKQAIDANKVSSDALKNMEPDVNRIKTYLDALDKKKDEALEALTWSLYASGNATLKLDGRDRFSYVLTAQDAQIVKDNSFTGKHLSGMSTVEVIYQVVSPLGKVVSTGGFSETVASETYNLNKGCQFQAPLVVTAQPCTEQ